MTTGEAALIQAVLADPRNDFPRLVLADYWEENGNADRAELVRVQVALSRLDQDELKRCLTPRRSHMGGEGAVGGLYKGTPFAACYRCAACVEWNELRRRERELFSDCPLDEWFSTGTPTEKLRQPRDMSFVDGDTVYFVRRGFIEVISCSWTRWLRNHEALFWSPKHDPRPSRGANPLRKVVLKSRVTPEHAHRWSRVRIAEWVCNRWPDLIFETEAFILSPFTTMAVEER